MPVADLGDVQIHYQRRGSGHPVLGIMGFGLDQRFWASQIPAVTERNEFITFDNRGIGRTTGATIATIDEMAHDAVLLLDHLEIERATVFGASMGGAIAQRIALDHPERVSALVLAITWARPIEFMRRLNDVARKVIEQGGADALVEAALVWMFTPEFFEVGREVIDQMVAAFFAESGPDAAKPDVLLAQLDAIDKHDALADLHRVACPTLVLGARRDMMTPGFASEEIAAAIPNAELTMFDAGHGVMVERMDEFNRRLSDFLATTN